LKGKTIGLSLPVDIISIGARQLLANHGLKPGDYKVKELVGTPARAACLKSGDCAATPLTQPDDVELTHEGFHMLGNSHEVFPTLQFTVFAARRTWASQHAETVTRFARAMGEAFKFMADPANRDEVIAIASEATGSSKDITAAIYKLYYEPYSNVLPKHAEINMPGISAVLRILAASKEIPSPPPPADHFVDLRYLKAAGLE
jgi:ABC-type nitrate/sulfonate/bicarbonate transport system substrate-binding protein